MGVLITIAKYAFIISLILYALASMFLLYIISHSYKGVQPYERRKFNIIMLIDTLLFSVASMFLAILYI